MPIDIHTEKKDGAEKALFGNRFEKWCPFKTSRHWSKSGQKLYGRIFYLLNDCERGGKIWLCNTITNGWVTIFDCLGYGKGKMYLYPLVREQCIHELFILLGVIIFLKRLVFNWFKFCTQNTSFTWKLLINLSLCKLIVISNFFSKCFRIIEQNDRTETI